MGIFDNKIHLALVAIVGAAIIGMVMAPNFAANGQTYTPVQFPAPTPPGAPEETPEESGLGGEPALGEEAPAPEEPLPVPGEEAPAPEEPEGLAPEEEEPEGAEETPEGVFSTSMSMSPTPDSEGTVAIEGAGLTIQDMNFDQSTEGADSKVRVEATFGVEPDGSTVEPMSPEREDGADGFFNAVQFSPAEGSWANIIIEGTGLTVKGMSVNQSMGPPSPIEEQGLGEEPLAPEEPLPAPTPSPAPMPGEEVTPAPEGMESTIEPENTDITPTQFPAPTPPGAPEETPEESAPGEEAPAPEEPLPVPGEETPAPGGEPAPSEEPLPAPLPEEEAPAPGELTPAPEPFGAPAPVPEEPLSTPGEEPEELAPGAAEAEPVEGETFTVTVEVTFNTGTTAGIFEEPTTGLPEAGPMTGPIIIEREPGAPSLAEEGITPEPATSEEEEESAASEEEEASLTLSEDSVAAGNDVNVRGTNFERNDEVTITLDGEPTDTFPEPVIAGSDGDVVSVLTIPDDISEGEHEIEASDESGNSGTVSITITATEELTEEEEEERPEGEVETPAIPEEEQGPTISETEPTEEVGEEEEESEPTS